MGNDADESLSATGLEGAARAGEVEGLVAEREVGDDVLEHRELESAPVAVFTRRNDSAPAASTQYHTGPRQASTQNSTPLKHAPLKFPEHSLCYIRRFDVLRQIASSARR